MKFLPTAFKTLSKPLRVTILTACILLLLSALVVIFISPIAEYVVEQNSEEWIGRKVEMQDLSLNLLTGKFEIKELKLFEKGNDTVFVSFDRFATDITLYKAIAGKYEITELVLEKPYVRIVQNGTHFNYDDLLTLGNDSSETKEPEDTTTSGPVEYWVNQIALKGATVDYSDKQLGAQFLITPINIGCKDIAWNDPQHQYHLDLAFASGGRMKMDLDLHLQTLDYKLMYLIEQFNLGALMPYLKPVANIQHFGALLSASFNVNGNFNQPESVAAKAKLTIDSLRIIDLQNRVVASLQNFDVQLDTLNTVNHQYTIHHVNITGPYLLVEMYTKGTNFDKLMVAQPKTAATEVPNKSNAPDPTAELGPFALIAHYIADFAKTLNENEYKVLSTSLTKGEIKYADFTLHDPFRFLLSNLQLSSGTFSSNDPAISLKAASDMNRKGHFDALAKISLSNYKDFVLNMDLTSLPMSSFNPYSTYFVAHPFWDGDIYFKSHNSVKKNQLVSKNALEVRKIEVGKKVKNQTAMNVPVKFAVALLRDRKGNIAIDIPVEGNLNDPNYKVGRAILKIVTNILVKAVTAPFDLLASNLKCNPDDLKFIRFDYTQVRPNEAQLKNLDLIAKVLDEKPGISVELTQAYNMEAEKDALAIFEMKKRFYLTKNNRLQSDSINYSEWDSVKQVDASDSLFVAFCNNAGRNSEPLASIQAKCRKAVGEKMLTEKETALASARNRFVYEYLTIGKKVKPERIRMLAAKEKEDQTDPSGKYIINFFAN
jgi:hypothetical protein